MSVLRRGLFWLARRRWLGRWVGWGFQFMSFAIPVQRLHETPTLLAFHHPAPSHPVHILIVPKRAIASLSEFDPAQHASFTRDLFLAIPLLVESLQLRAYTLLVNGGDFQDVAQLHFHLIGEAAPPAP